MLREQLREARLARQLKEQVKPCLAHIAIDDQDAHPLLRERHRKIGRGRRLAILRRRTCNHDGAKRLNRLRKDQVRPQRAIRFRAHGAKVGDGHEGIRWNTSDARPVIPGSLRATRRSCRAARCRDLRNAPRARVRGASARHRRDAESSCSDARRAPPHHRRA